MATTSSESPTTTPEETPSQENVVKRGRGQPRKHPVDEDVAENTSGSSQLPFSDNVPDEVNGNITISA